MLDSEAEVVLVSCAYETMDSEGSYLGTWRGDEPHEVVTWLLNFYNIVGGGGQVMFRRSEVIAEGGYTCEYPSSEDYDLWVRLLRRGRIVTLPLIGMKQRHHNARSAVQYASVKRANWTAIVSQSLGRYLGHPIGDEEIAALITLWRHDGTTGMAPIAERTMREAFARFCGEHSDPARKTSGTAFHPVERSVTCVSTKSTKAGRENVLLHSVLRACADRRNDSRFSTHFKRCGCGLYRSGIGARSTFVPSNSLNSPASRSVRAQEIPGVHRQGQGLKSRL